MQDFLHFASALADQAAPIAMRYWRHALTVETKPDRTPVTQADKEVEILIRDAIAARFPEHGIVGEEFGNERMDAEYRWIIDPIDGTEAFLRGVPNFATLIGLEKAGEVVLGYISAPAMGLRWWGGKGLGAFENGQPITVSTVASLTDAHICHGQISLFGQYGFADQWKVLWPQTWRQSGFGDFYGHMLVASGAADLVPEPIVFPWDVAAIKAVVEGAGGRYTDMTGSDNIYSGHSLSSNGILHDVAIEIMRPRDITNS